MKRGEVIRLADAMTREIPRVCEESKVPPDTCVLQTRLAVEVGRAAGLRVQPWPVRVRVFSPEAVRRIAAGEAAPETLTEELTEEWLAAGATIAMIGYGTAEPIEEGRWDGHLCALAERRYLIDPSIGQLRYSLRRPIEDAEPFWTEVTREFAKGTEPVHLELPGGSVAEYVAEPGRTDFFSNGDPDHWNRDKRLAQAMLKRVRAAR